MSTECKNTFGRIVKRYSNTAGVQPTVPASSDHKDGTWLSTDIYEGEEFVNTADSRAYIRANNSIKEYFLGSLYGGCKTYCTSGTITSGQIRTLHTSPVTVVSAPGANKVIVLEKAVHHYKYSTAPYGGVGFLGYYLKDNSVQGTAIFQDLASITNSVDKIEFLNRGNNFNYMDELPITSTNAINQPLVLTMFNDASFAVGNPSAGYGSLNYYLWYRIINL